MTANGEFSAVNAANLTIYGQRLGTGKLIATGNPDGEGDGINAGDVTINGGQVTASGSSCGIYVEVLLLFADIHHFVGNHVPRAECLAGAAV